MSKTSYILYAEHCGFLWAEHTLALPMPAVALKLVLRQEVVHMLLAGLSLGYPAAQLNMQPSLCLCRRRATDVVVVQPTR